MLADIFRRLFSSPGRRTYTANCWVCGTDVNVDISDIQRHHHQDTLGGAFSFEACPSCIEKRGTDKKRVAFICLLATPDLSTPPTREAQIENTKGIFRSLDAGGERYGRPIHIYFDAQYIEIADWIKADEHQCEVGKMFSDGFTVPRILGTKTGF